MTAKEYLEQVSFLDEEIHTYRSELAESVSYTHLDVYKRQVLIILSSARSTRLPEKS